MYAQVSHWGNSLGLRIPKVFSEALGIHEGSRVNLELKTDKIVIKLAQEEASLTSMARDMDLEAMVGRITTRNKHRLTENQDRPRGGEVW